MIKFLKLVSGEELITSMKEVNGEYVLVWPMHVYTDTDEEGNPRNRVVPFTQHVKAHTVTVAKGHVIYVAEPAPLILEYYEKNILAMLPVAEETTAE